MSSIKLLTLKFLLLVYLIYITKCAPPTKDNIDGFIDEELSKIREHFQSTGFQGTCRNTRVRTRRHDYALRSKSKEEPAKTVLTSYINKITSKVSNRLESKNGQAGTIYRYAYIKPDPNNPDGPVLPLLISAKITKQTLSNVAARNGSNSVPTNAKNNVNKMGKYTNRPDNNNDENGHLIAYENGGPSEVYNFAPQPRSLNRGIVRGVEIVRESDWVRSENSINNWVISGSGWVDETVVVVYNNIRTNPRPEGFVQHIVYYYLNNTIRYECVDYYSNDPMSEPTFSDIPKRLGN